MTRELDYLAGLQIRRTASLIAVVAVLFAILPSACKLSAQTVSGINGTVLDTSGAVVPGARITATNKATGVSSESVTTSEGTFAFVGLLPGSYSVTVDTPRFKKTELTVTVEVAKVSSINVQMEVGSTTETVQVQASAIALETTSPTIGTTLEPELVKTAPIEINSLARQIDSFMYLAPGVQGDANSHNINGGVTYENEVQFNGIPAAFVDFAGNQTNINPPYESVSEFRVNSSTFDARFGLGQGSVSYQMASGANAFHGDGFEILRNQFLDSTYFFPTTFNSKGHAVPPVDQAERLWLYGEWPYLDSKGLQRKESYFSFISLRTGLSRT